MIIAGYKDINEINKSLLINKIVFARRRRFLRVTDLSGPLYIFTLFSNRRILCIIRSDTQYCARYSQLKFEYLLKYEIKIIVAPR